MAATGVRRPVCFSGRGDAALRTASPAEVARSLPGEKPGSSVNSGINVRAHGFCQF